ncbi:hypothetical protein Cantr_01464 [Candida viswanathii]|uniref:Uncharacterized protein n=1 Tax=Candida viswanathii TaxID=5486 RepID=A0A367YL47_9ASCO|nr:hypothetical protein Cantr_01464 [Candida viswanathii]
MSLRKAALSKSDLRDLEKTTPSASPSVVNLTEPELYGIYKNDDNISKEFVEDSSEIEKIKSREVEEKVQTEDKHENLVLVVVFGLLFCIFIYRKFIQS